MQKTVGVGISLPKNVISKIDEERGDISRSRYLLRLLEKGHEGNNKQNIGVEISNRIKKPLQTDTRVGTSVNQSTIAA